MAAKDYYGALGVDPQASPDDIKQAFRRLARQYHPDANGGDPAAAERYKDISEAYAVLGDPGRRREYDQARLGFGGFSPFATTIEDIFDTFFGGGGRRRGPRSRARAGESIEIAVELDFRDAIFGVSRSLTLPRHEPCGACGGTGAEPGTHPERCQRCAGTGAVQQVRRSAFGSLVTSYPCAACGESGQVIASPCRRCSGSGRVVEEVELPLEIPPGIEDGDRLRMSGQGESGAGGGPRGDLYVRFVVRPDDRFMRAGDDLVTWAEVPMTAAALGGEIRFESLDGEERLDVPRGSQSGQLFRLRGRGAPRRHGRGRGDLLVRIHVLTPTDLDGEQEKLMRRLAELRDEGAGRTLFGRLRRALGFEE